MLLVSGCLSVYVVRAHLFNRFVKYEAVEKRQANINSGTKKLTQSSDHGIVHKLQIISVESHTLKCRFRLTCVSSLDHKKKVHVEQKGTFWRAQVFVTTEEVQTGSVP